MTTIAKLFGEIGFKIPKQEMKKLGNFQKRLTNVKKQLQDINRLGRQALSFRGDTAQLRQSLGILRQINQELSKARRGATIGVRTRGAAAGGGRVSRGVFSGSALGSAVGQFAPGVGVAGALAFGGADIFKVSNEFIAIKNALQAITGDGQGQFERLKNLSNEIGINFRSSARAYSNFLAAGSAVGFDLAVAEQSFRDTATAARILGLSADDIRGTFRGMQQMLSKGTVNMEDFRQQVAERMPIAFGAMAKAMKMSVPDMLDKIATGTVQTKDVMAEFTAEMLKMVEAGKEVALNSPEANFQRFLNLLDEAKKSIGDAGFLKSLSDSFKQLSESMRSGSGGTELISFALEFIVRSLTALFSIISDIPTPFLALIGIIGIFAFKTSAVIAVVALAALVVEDLIAGLNEGRGLFADLARSGGPLGTLVKTFLDAMNAVKAFLDAIALLGAFSLDALFGDAPFSVKLEALKAGFSDISNNLTNPKFLQSKSGTDSGLTVNGDLTVQSNEQSMKALTEELMTTLPVARQ